MSVTEKDNVFYCDCGFSWRRGMSGSHHCEDGLRVKLTDMAVQLANAESKCRELAAENAGLKAICDDRRTFIMNGVQLGYIQVPTVETDPALETIRTAVSPQAPTPATGAFLAEVRASGADEVSVICRGLANKDGCSVNMRCSYNLTAERAEAVAAQLREGAAL